MTMYSVCGSDVSTEDYHLTLQFFLAFTKSVLIPSVCYMQPIPNDKI